MKSEDIKRVTIALLLTAVVIVLAVLFLRSVSLPLAAGIGMTEEENIRNLTSFRLVPPEWVTAGTHGLRHSWMLAESIARMALLFGAWLLLMVLVNPFRRERSTQPPPEAYSAMPRRNA